MCGMDSFHEAPDPVEQFFDWVLLLRTRLRLIATSFPGQELHVVPAPEHLLQHLADGKSFPPFVREATADELIDWVYENRPDLAP